MTDRPLIFSAPMVRALLDGRKTQTRRVLKPQPFAGGYFEGDISLDAVTDDVARFSAIAVGGVDFVEDFIPFRWQPGDRAWVRETHSIYQTHGQHRDDGQRWGPWSGLPTRVSPDGTQIAYYREGFDRCDPGRWRSPIHMPRWASRITLNITDVRVQRVQDITEADAVNEGFTHHHDPSGDGTDTRELFAMTWTAIHGPGSWDANPWVCALTFTVEKESR